jgi:hypothetical protein
MVDRQVHGPNRGDPEAFIQAQQRLQGIGGYPEVNPSSMGMSYKPGLPQQPAPPRRMDGMSYTPSLPGPQKRYYDRVAQEQGPQQPYQVPQYPGRQAAGTYTAPYDAPAGPRGPALRGSEKLTSLPPGYAERYGLNKPASTPAATPSAPPTRSWLEAAREQAGGFQQAAEQKVAEVKQQIAETEKKYGKITPAKVKMALWWNNLVNGGGGGAPLTPAERRERYLASLGGGRNSGTRASGSERRIGLPATPAAAVPVPPVPEAQPDMSYFTNVMTREEALRRLLGEEWYA